MGLADGAEQGKKNLQPCAVMTCANQLSGYKLLRVQQAFWGGIRRPGTSQRRTVPSEWSTIDHNQIRNIHAVMFYRPPEAPMPSWPPNNGNRPLPAALTQ